jgi:hypothetical protein
VLVFQGGGALGAYQGGVYQALHEAEIKPNWVIGTSIGAINGAIIVATNLIGASIACENFGIAWSARLSPTEFQARACRRIHMDRRACLDHPLARSITRSRVSAAPRGCMNAVEIEQAISALAEQPFDAQEFAVTFLEAFGNKETTARNKGHSDKRSRAGYKAAGMRQQAVTAVRVLPAALFALILVTPTVASEQAEICAEYTDTGRSYHVTAISTTGLELNQATHSRNYSSIGRYIVIFWPQDQASVNISRMIWRLSGGASTRGFAY